MSEEQGIAGRADTDGITAWVIDMAPNDLNKAVGRVDRDAVDESAQIQITNDMFAEHGAIVPPHPPDVLARLYEMSSALRPNIQAIMNNVDGFGHRLEERLDTDPDKRREQVEDALLAEALEDVEEEDDISDSIMPDADAVRQRLRRIELLMKVEHLRIENFFGFCCVDKSFEKLRMVTRQDLEIFGYGFWEVLRGRPRPDDIDDGSDETKTRPMGKVAQFAHVSAMTCRLMPLDHHHIEVPAFEPVSAIAYRPATVKRRFRRFIQVSGGKVVFFKEFGDPRIMSRATGKRYPTIEAMRDMDMGEGPDAREAHELIHFKIDSPRSPYGMPRWIGAFPAVLGGREAEEVNLMYFNNKSVPPLAILVQGGKLTDGAVDRIREHIRKNVQGKQNFHEILVLEGETGATKGKKDAAPSRVRIDIKNLTGAQLNDAQFLKYTERAQETIGAQFSLPPIMRGMMRDFNRSTADAALRYAEIAVFEPLRKEFDFFVNMLLVRELGIRFWKFVSNAPINRDPRTLSTIIKDLLNAGALVPEDGRRLAADIFNEELPRLDQSWVKRPLQLTVAGITDDAIAKSAERMVVQDLAPIIRLAEVCEKLIPLLRRAATAA